MLDKYIKIPEKICNYLFGLTEKSGLKEWEQHSIQNSELLKKISSEEWIRENFKDIDNEFQAKKIEAAWGKTNAQISKYDVIPISSPILSSRYVALATISLVITFSALFYLLSSNNNRNFVNGINVKDDIIALVLSDGKVINLSEVKNFRAVEKDGSIIIGVDGKVLYTRAQTNSSIVPKEIFNRFIVPKGKSYSITFSDGSEVFIDAMSSLSFPVSFGHERRVVELIGAGYFNIAKSNTPFIVNAIKTQVLVLGTEFFISSYLNEKKIHTGLVSGTISIKHQGHSWITLNPSQQCDYSLENKDLKIIDIDENFVNSIKSDYIIFKDKSLKEIMNSIQKWYKVEVFYKEVDPTSIKIGCKINKNESIDKFLEFMELTLPVKVQKINNKIYITLDES